MRCLINTLNCKNIKFKMPETTPIPKIDLEELKKFKEQNFKERLEFIEKYAEWVKSQPNKVWSKQQKELID